MDLDRMVDISDLERDAASTSPYIKRSQQPVAPSHPAGGHTNSYPSVLAPYMPMDPPNAGRNRSGSTSQRGGGLPLPPITSLGGSGNGTDIRSDSLPSRRGSLVHGLVTLPSVPVLGGGRPRRDSVNNQHLAPGIVYPRNSTSISPPQRPVLPPLSQAGPSRSPQPPSVTAPDPSHASPRLRSGTMPGVISRSSSRDYLPRSSPASALSRPIGSTSRDAGLAPRASPNLSATHRSPYLRPDRLRDISSHSPSPPSGQRLVHVGDRSVAS